MNTTRLRSTAQDRRPLVIHQAVECFAAGGWAGTTYADVAAAAGISPAYVVKLFPRKEELFVAALQDCFDRIEQALLEVGASPADGPDAVLDRMGDAYARLIADRPVLMLQVHANPQPRSLRSARHSHVASNVSRCSSPPTPAPRMPQCSGSWPTANSATSS